MYYNNMTSVTDIITRVSNIDIHDTHAEQPKVINNHHNYTDNYTVDILRLRFNTYKKSYIDVNVLKVTGLAMRQQNPPEDITENIVKYIIRNYDNDASCVWCKGVDSFKKLSGDLYSNKYNTSAIEVKAFTSNGPSQFGPNKKFEVLYFLDMRNWLNDVMICWRVNLSSESNEFKMVKVNKTQTHIEQCEQGRRPHINWNRLYPQIKNFCVKVYEGSFEEIFNNYNNSTNLLTIKLTTGNDTALPAKLYNLLSDSSGSL